MPKGVQFRVEFILLVSSEADVEVLGFLVVIFVDAYLTGVDGCIGVTGAIFIFTTWRGCDLKYYNIILRI